MIFACPAMLAFLKYVRAVKTMVEHFRRKSKLCLSRRVSRQNFF
jgi:hypothetical protein